MVALSKTTLILSVLGLIGVSGAAATFITINVIEKQTIEHVSPQMEAIVKEPKEVIHTVEWYQSNPDSRKETVKKCVDNPGELRSDPNCINAQQASVRDTSGGLIRFGE